MLESSNNTALSKDGIDTEYRAEPWGADIFYARGALYPGYLTGSEDGQPLAPLLGELVEFDGGIVDVGVGPATYLLIYSDHALVYRFTPLDVQLSDMEVTWLVNQSAEEGADYDLERLTWLWHVTSEADKCIINNNQAGINSRFYQPGPFSEMEFYSSAFVGWYLRSLSP